MERTGRILQCRVTLLLVALALAGCSRTGTQPVAPARAQVQAAAPAALRHVDFRDQARSEDVARVADWIVNARDNQGRPFAILDKHEARLFVFRGRGELVGSTSVLLGQAKGDDTVPGIGDRPIRDVKPFERTTPAGRFVAEHGANLRGEHVIWIDYDAAVSMHPVLTTNPGERRLERLRSPNPEDHRISYGCVNVPKAFFREVVLKTLDAQNPIVYVLPETKRLSDVFAGFAEGTVTRTARR